MIASRLLLASSSPRRAEILKTLGLPFTVVASNFEEPRPTPEDCREPASYVMRLAREKAANAVLARESETAGANSAIVIGADTVVWLGGEIFGKPTDTADAASMLRTLRNRSHQVLTGVCLRITGTARDSSDEYHVAHSVTAVHFRDASDDWIARYVATGEPLDKAGAYAAQGRGAALVERIEGDFWNVVGLPLATLAGLLETVGSPFENWWE